MIFQDFRTVFKFSCFSQIFANGSLFAIPLGCPLPRIFFSESDSLNPFPFQAPKPDLRDFDDPKISRQRAANNRAASARNELD